MKKKITIFGSTGSVGKSTLDIFEHHKDKFELVGLTINKNYKELFSQIKKFKPKVVSIRDETAYKNCLPFWQELEKIAQEKRPRKIISNRGIVIFDDVLR